MLNAANHSKELHYRVFSPLLRVATRLYSKRRSLFAGASRAQSSILNKDICNQARPTHHPWSLFCLSNLIISLKLFCLIWIQQET
jgi:hypothetical protein